MEPKIFTTCWYEVISSISLCFLWWLHELGANSASCGGLFLLGTVLILCCILRELLLTHLCQLQTSAVFSMSFRWNCKTHPRISATTTLLCIAFEGEKRRPEIRLLRTLKLYCAKSIACKANRPNSLPLSTLATQARIHQLYYIAGCLIY